MNSRVRTLLMAGAVLLAPLPLAAATGVANLSNISTRLQVDTGDSVAIAGFIVQGTGNKQVLIRALGPSLTPLGVSGALADPTLELHDESGQIIATNDNWDQSANIQAWHTSLGLNLPQASESVISMSLAPGAYTAIVRGVNGTTGVALVEVYDCDGTAPCAPINISTRGVVRSGAAVMIGGFIVQGTIPKQVLVRAIGPELSALGVSNVLTDPQLDIYDSTGAKIYSNNDWQSQPDGGAAVTATGKAPTDPREAALVATLNPGAYTVIVSGASGAQGNALVEVYDLQPTDPAPSPSNGTLYLADLRAAPGVTTSGSGTAALSVNSDGMSAIVSVSYSNLSGPITNAHLEASADSPFAGLNLFDLSPGAVQADGTWIWYFAFTNGNLTAGEVLSLIQNGQVDIRIYTADNPGGELLAAFSAANGGQTFSPPALPPPLPGGPMTANDASRLLTQATFGPTNGNPATDKTSIAYVQSKGIDAWLTEQVSLPTTTLMSYVDSVWDPSIGNTQGATAAHYGWWLRAATAPDQLRQRVAYALSQIIVVSSNSTGLNSNPIGIGAYYDVLLSDAFGNFRQLLNDITLNPGMGEFLDMAGNKKGDPVAGTNPNENYAREVNQLFSIGLYQLYPDGTLELDGRGLPIPTYAQTTVTGFARVFTGWNYAAPTTSFPPINLRDPMIEIATRHEPGSKTLLNGMTIPAVGSATTSEMNSDLKTALDNIFYHPNVGPFIARQLIQRLVTSNPSPGYVYRIAQVFANNGAGVRGDIKAVVFAILKDYEARTTDLLGFQGTGKQLEPVLRTTKTMRAFRSSPFTSGGTLAGPFYNFDTTFGQTPLRALTVFNFYSPDYAAPGDISSAGLVSPEFEITTETTVISTANFLRTLIFSGQGAGANKVSLDFSAFTGLAVTDPSTLLDQLNVLLMSGQMDANTKTQILNAVTPISASDGGFNRVHNAVYLIVTSPQFATQR